MCWLIEVKERNQMSALREYTPFGRHCTKYLMLIFSSLEESSKSIFRIDKKDQERWNATRGHHTESSNWKLHLQFLWFQSLCSHWGLFVMNSLSALSLERNKPIDLVWNSKVEQRHLDNNSLIFYIEIMFRQKKNYVTSCSQVQRCLQ